VETWERLHPHWERWLWGDDEVASLPRGKLIESVSSPAQRSDLARVDILREYGGVYVDADFEAVSCIDPLLALGDFIVGAEDPPERNNPPYICNAFIASTPSHPCLARYSEVQERRLRLLPDASPNVSTGPFALTDVVRATKAEVVVLPREALYPYGWWEPEARERRFPETLAVHHWDASWT